MSNNRTVKLVLGFIGTRYEGWQSQKKGNTLQEVFEKTLAKILKEKIDLISSSRTDSGVHARGLAAHFRTKNPLPDPAIKNALNFYLPKDTVVYSAKTMPNRFHARFDAGSKIYHYQIWTGKERPLFEAPFMLWYPHPLDLGAMRKAAIFLEGTHDFSAFRDRGSEDEKEDRVRVMKKLAIRKKKNLIRIEIEGSGFLRHMVRVIVGTLLEVGRKRIKPEEIKRILRSGDRRKAGPTAKPHGLILMEVKYG